LKLDGLAQAIFILKAFGNGQSEQQIVDTFEGYFRLVKMWKSFLIDIQWMELSDGDKWKVTDRGKLWIGAVESKFEGA
jgi:hypothetical protein